MVDSCHFIPPHSVIPCRVEAAVFIKRQMHLCFCSSAPPVLFPAKTAVAAWDQHSPGRHKTRFNLGEGNVIHNFRSDVLELILGKH